MSDAPPADSTSRLQPDKGPSEEGAPQPPHEMADALGQVEERRFVVAGQSWIARVSGKGAAGTGAYGLGLIEAVHFFAEDAPDRPLHEALIARNRFNGLFDEELAALLARATPIVLPEER